MTAILIRPGGGSGEAVNAAGPLSELPAIGTVPDGFTYAATDVLAFYVADAGAWVRMRNSGEEIGFAEKANGNHAMTTAAGAHDIPDLLPITFDVNAGEVVYVEATGRGGTGAAAGASAVLYITDNANAIKAVGTFTQAYTGGAVVGLVRPLERISAPGTYTRKLRGQAFGNSVTAYATVQNELRLRAWVA